MTSTASTLTDAQLDALADLARAGQQPELLVWLGVEDDPERAFPLVAFRGPAGATLTGLLMPDGTFDASTLGVLPACPDVYEHADEGKPVDA